MFHHVGFKAISVVGYPPPWPLLLGCIYRGFYAVGHQLLVYNLAIKLPVIAATVALAYLVAAIVQNLGASRPRRGGPGSSSLLNPFLLYFGAAWGQIDAIAALLALAALVLAVSPPEPLGRGAGAGRLLQADRGARAHRGPRLPADPIGVAGRALRGGVPRRGVRLLRGPLPAAWLERGAAAAVQLAVRDDRHDVVHDGRQARQGPAAAAGHWWLLGLVWVPALAVAAAIGLRHGVADVPRISSARAPRSCWSSSSRAPGWPSPTSCWSCRWCSCSPRSATSTGAPSPPSG